MFSLTSSSLWITTAVPQRSSTRGCPCRAHAPAASWPIDSIWADRGVTVLERYRYCICVHRHILFHLSHSQMKSVHTWFFFVVQVADDSRSPSPPMQPRPSSTFAGSSRNQYQDLVPMGKWECKTSLPVLHTFFLGKILSCCVLPLLLRPHLRVGFNPMWVTFMPWPSAGVGLKSGLEKFSVLTWIWLWHLFLDLSQSWALYCKNWHLSKCKYLGYSQIYLVFPIIRLQ